MGVENKGRDVDELGGYKDSPSVDHEVGMVVLVHANDAGSNSLGDGNCGEDRTSPADIATQVGKETA